MEFALLRKNEVVFRFSALTRQEANQTLRNKCTSDLLEYTLAQLLRTGTPRMVVTLDRVDEVDA